MIDETGIKAHPHSHNRHRPNFSRTANRIKALSIAPVHRAEPVAGRRSEDLDDTDAGCRAGRTPQDPKPSLPPR
jgi:hypothetical protein